MKAKATELEVLVQEILKDNRAKFNALISAAIDRALANLNNVPPPETL